MAVQIGATNTDEGYFDLLDGGSTKVRIAANMPTYFKDKGLIIGHTGQITSNNGVSEFQILGTGAASNNRAAMVIGRWSDDIAAPGLEFMKSYGPTVGSHGVVEDGARLGEIKFVADDGSDFITLAAMLRVEVDDASPASDDTGGAFVFHQAGGGGVALRETMRLSAAGVLTTYGTGGTNIGNNPNRTVKFFDTTTSGSAVQANVGAGISLGGIAKFSGLEQWDFASLRAYKDNATDDDPSGGLVIHTRHSDNSGKALVERMRITSLGNVGIGTNPSSELHIKSSSPELRIEASDGQSSLLSFYE